MGDRLQGAKRAQASDGPRRLEHQAGGNRGCGPNVFITILQVGARGAARTDAGTPTDPVAPKGDDASRRRETLGFRHACRRRARRRRARTATLAVAAPVTTAPVTACPPSPCHEETSFLARRPSSVSAALALAPSPRRGGGTTTSSPTVELLGVEEDSTRLVRDDDDELRGQPGKDRLAELLTVEPDPAFSCDTGSGEVQKCRGAFEEFRRSRRWADRGDLLTSHRLPVGADDCGSEDALLAETIGVDAETLFRLVSAPARDPATGALDPAKATFAWFQARQPRMRLTQTQWDHREPIQSLHPPLNPPRWQKQKHMWQMGTRGIGKWDPRHFFDPSSKLLPKKAKAKAKATPSVDSTGAGGRKRLGLGASRGGGERLLHGRDGRGRCRHCRSLFLPSSNARAHLHVPLGAWSRVRPKT